MLEKNIYKKKTFNRRIKKFGLKRNQFEDSKIIEVKFFLTFVIEMNFIHKKVFKNHSFKKICNVKFQ